MKLLKFTAEMFEKGREFPKGWHLLNEAEGQQGEYTLCGIAFDGDAIQVKHSAIEKTDGKVTCERCIEIIKLCKQAKY